MQRCDLQCVAGRWLPTASRSSELSAADLSSRWQLEPFIHENATRWAHALGDAGVDVVMTERVGSHGGAFWQEELPLMAAWAFRP